MDERIHPFPDPGKSLPDAVRNHRQRRTPQKKVSQGSPFSESNGESRYINETIRSAMILMILIIGLIAGPAVSLYGSHTVSQVTAALWASEPFPQKNPSSMYFLALSHAQPQVVMEMATKIPVRIAPMSIPQSAIFAKMNPCAPIYKEPTYPIAK